LPPVDDGDDPRPPFRRHGDGPVGVRGGSRLGDGNDQGVGETFRQVETAQFRGDAGRDLDAAFGEIPGTSPGDRLAGHRGGAVADDDDPFKGAGRKGLPDGGRHDVGAEIEAYRPAAIPFLTELVFAPQCFSYGSAGLVYLLEEKVGMIPPVDVPCCDLRPPDQGGSDRQRRPAVGTGPDSLRPAGITGPEDEDLSRFFSVHLEEIRRALHQPVEFRGEEVAITGEPHIDGLAASPQGQKGLSRFHVGGHGDGVRALKTVHRAAEGLGGVTSGPQVPFDLQGDNFGVRGYRRGDELAAGL